ncbi:MAG: hypothetical protein IH913_06965, partial [Proteobacteria bacterium]|nr:hypothetical protein [Pseudomonadota bacterium]
MKQLSIFMAVLALTFFAFFPAYAHADDTMEDLDITMVVVDDAGDLEGTISEMSGPDDHDVSDDDWEDEEHDGDGARDDERDERHDEDEESDERDDESREDGGEHDDGFEHDNVR